MSKFGIGNLLKGTVIAAPIMLILIRSAAKAGEFVAKEFLK